jgi:hypothetical protein
MMVDKIEEVILKNIKNPIIKQILKGFWEFKSYIIYLVILFFVFATIYFGVINFCIAGGCYSLNYYNESITQETIDSTNNCINNIKIKKSN